MHLISQISSEADGLLQLLGVFALALLPVIGLMLLWRFLGAARDREMTLWAERMGYAYQQEGGTPAWFSESTLPRRLLRARLRNLCSTRDVQLGDVEYVQLQVSGEDTLGATVIALQDTRRELPRFRLIPDAWDPLDGPEPIRTGMPSKPGTFESGRFDDRAGRERREGMTACPATNYLITTESGIKLNAAVQTALEQAGGLRFEGSGPWVLAISDRRVDSAALHDLIDQARSVAAALRAAGAG